MSATHRCRALLQLLLLTIVTLAFALYPATAQSCGGAGYDVSSVVGHELTISSGGWNWTIAPCGTVRGNAICANETHGAMFCQWNANTAWTVATYNVTTIPSARWLALSNGVQLSIESGEYCGAARAPREATVQFICETTAITPRLVSVTEPEVCWYNAIIQTNAACSTVGPTGPTNQIGSQFWSTQCGGGVYDLSTVSAQDLYFDNLQYRYWVRACGLVSNSSCASAQPTSFCQQNTFPGAAPVDAGQWNTSIAQVWTITDTGISVNVRQGDRCAVVNGDRQATLNFVCNPYITKPRVSYVSEDQTCEYTAVIQTPAVCNGNNAPLYGYCGGAGYDLTDLNDIDLQVQANGYNWFIKPCGVISVPGVCTGQQSMMCQTTPDRSIQWNVASWNRTIAENGVTWLAINNGVQYSVAGGAPCGGAGDREVTMQFICNETASWPWVESVTEPEVCWYNVRIHTLYACDRHDGTAPHVPGSSYYDSQCGGRIYDFDNIKDQGDIVFDSSPGTPNSGWRYYLSMCGNVQQRNCSSVQPSMLCQLSKSNLNDQYSLAYFNASQPAIYTVANNGVSMTIEDGTRCGNIPERRSTIQVICDGTTPALITSVREPETCRYTVVLHAQCYYMPGEGPSSTGMVRPMISSSSVRVSVSSSSGTDALPEPSSSSLSGGAIAGIVIGAIVGALILCAVVAVVACGAGGFTRGKKSSSGNAGGSGKFSDLEHSQQSTVGEVEMETA